MAVEGHGADLLQAVALLGAGVVAVPIFKRIGLGSVIGYLAAGVAIGPFGLALFRDPAAILGVAEFGVVLEQLVEVAVAEQDEHPRVLGLGVVVLLHHAGRHGRSQSSSHQVFKSSRREHQFIGGPSGWE